MLHDITKSLIRLGIFSYPVFLVRQRIWIEWLVYLQCLQYHRLQRSPCVCYRLLLVGVKDFLREFYLDKNQTKAVDTLKKLEKFCIDNGGEYYLAKTLIAQVELYTKIGDEKAAAESKKNAEIVTVSYTHLRAHETREDLVLRGLL